MGFHGSGEGVEVARIFMTGFEAGHIGILNYTYGASVSVTQVRTGARSLWVEGSGKANLTLAEEPNEIYVRFGLYNTAYGYYAARLCNFSDSGGNVLVAFAINKTTSLLEARVGSVSAGLVATGTIQIPLNAWVCIEMHIYIHDTSGRIETKVDGVADIDYTGDTKPATEDGIYTMWLADNSNDRSAVGYWDDIAINDTSGTKNNSWIGRGGIVLGQVNGAGTYAQFTPSAGDNYACVDDIPPNDDTDYVESDVVGNKDLYSITPITPTSGVIDAVQWIARAKLDVAGSGNFKRLMRHNGVDYSGSDLAVDASYRYFTEIFDKAPDNADWSIAKVNALEIGMEVS